MKVYFDNNVYNYMVDGKTIEKSNVMTLVEAVKDKKLEVIFSPINLFEIVRCYENKDEKARKMLDLSFNLTNKVANFFSQFLLCFLFRLSSYLEFRSKKSTLA
ncbi:hypothetical protein ES703_73814 [subsurface metagenome]